MALQKNLDLKRERNNKIQSKAEFSQSKFDLIPDVNAFTQGTRNNGNNFIPQLGRLVNETVYSAYSEINAEGIIFNGLRQLNTIHRAKTLNEAQQELLNWTQQDVIYNVSLQYMQVLLDHQLLTIASENLEAQEKQLERITGMVDAGAIPIVDQYNQEAEVGRVKLEVVRREAQLETDKAVLAQLIMLDPTKDFSVEDPGFEINLDLYGTRDLSNLYDEALTNRSDLKNLELRSEAAEYDVAIAKGSLVPSIVGGYTFSSYYTDASDSPFEQQVETENLSKLIYISLRVPLFNGLRARTDVARARVNQENTHILYEQQARKVYTDLQQAYLDYSQALASYELGQKQVAATQLAFDAQSERYKLGSATYVEFTEANRALAEAKANMAQAEITLRFQKTVLDYQTGNLSIHTID
ncbi:MAG: TolC family protein [Cyclobacteriaceae bacterium]